MLAVLVVVFLLLSLQSSDMLGEPFFPSFGFGLATSPGFVPVERACKHCMHAHGIDQTLSSNFFNSHRDHLIRYDAVGLDDSTVGLVEAVFASAILGAGADFIATGTRVWSVWAAEPLDVNE